MRGVLKSRKSAAIVVTEAWESNTIRDFPFSSGVVVVCEVECCGLGATGVSEWGAVGAMRVGKAMWAKT